jgi:hypothetical protein
LLELDTRFLLASTDLQSKFLETLGKLLNLSKEFPPDLIKLSNGHISGQVHVCLRFGYVACGPLALFPLARTGRVDPCALLLFSSFLACLVIRARFIFLLLVLSGECLLLGLLRSLFGNLLVLDRLLLLGMLLP